MQFFSSFFGGFIGAIIGVLVLGAIAYRFGGDDE
jgi:hypothetical protein